MPEARPAPYPADTRAKGWRFELDMEQVRQSDTWALSPAEARPWLLLEWAVAWEQTPCGSLPNDDTLIAARLEMPAKMFAKYRAVLLRGWWLADDGRLYHDTLARRVMEMMQRRRKESDRKALARARPTAPMPQDYTPVPPLSHGTGAGLHPESDTGTGTGTGTIEEPKSLLPQAPAFPAENRPAEPPQLSLVEATKPRTKTVPDCPHQAVLALWAEVLPALPQHNAGMWGGTRADHLRARWRETAVAEKWETEADGIAYLRRLFVYIGRSAFLTGRSKGGGDRPPFVAELAWVVNPQNWAKVHEGKYHTDAA